MFWFYGTLPVRSSLSVSSDEASEQYRQQTDGQRAAGEHGGRSAAKEAFPSGGGGDQKQSQKREYRLMFMLICVCINMLASTTSWTEDEMIFFNTETPTEKQPTAQSTSANQQPVSS